MIDQICESLHVVGGEIRKHLKREIQSKVLFRRARDVVLLSGPTGTGKEIIAAACHESAKLGLKRSGNLIEVNCANLGNGVFESELFGYRRGAFTGADRDFPGLVSRAQGGTLVLDEIQSLTPQDQARLLRFLGEREFRSVGDDKVKKSDALIILSTNRNLKEMVATGEFRRDILDRASAKIRIPCLYERRSDIGELAQAFALEVGRDLEVTEFYGLTRRARADVEAAVVRSQEVSVRRLREVVRDAVFMAAVDSLPEAIESDFIAPLLEREFAFDESDRDLQDVVELEQEFDMLVARTKLREISQIHGTSMRALNQVCKAVKSLIDEMETDKRSYRNISDRTHRMSKVALWLVSGASSQAEFRRFFGEHSSQMPTKSVAHQIYYEVFPKDLNQ